MGLNNTFFDWSLSKIIDNETDSLNKAKYKILYTIFLLFFLKVIFTICIASYFGQTFQLYRALGLLILYTILFKSFLSKRLSLKVIAHIIVVSCLVLVSSIIFITSKAINIVSLQFTFTLILCSFYIIGSTYGMFYSFLGVGIILSSMLFNFKFTTHISAQSLASPGYEIIVALNFLTIIYIPYLFHQAFLNTIKEKEELNLKLQAAVEVSSEDAQMKTNFLSTMSHELRTPLNAVIGTTNLLLSDPFDKEQESNLNDLKFSANCLHDIVNDILDFNKLDSANLKLETIKVNLVQLIKSVCSGLEHQADGKGIDLNIDYDPEIGEFDVIADPTRITQIIYNLVGNAIKFTNKGSVSVGLKILAKKSKMVSLRFSVKDTGIGIPDAKRQSIFEPFNQASSSITRNFGGTGLGLAIVKRLILLFKSEIKLESKVGEGSKFYFDIDFKYFKKDSINTKEAVTKNYDLKDLKILVAEDNLMNRVLIKKVLSKWNNEPVFAENGQEAIELSKANFFDIILMDLNMPKVDGFDAAKAIRNDERNCCSNTPIIAFTASVSNTILNDIKAAGMDDFIYKPFNTEDLYIKLRAVKSQNLVMN